MSPEIEQINRSLMDSYGIDTESGLPMWRVVWSDDQREKRLTKYTPLGIELLHKEVFELPKYQHVRHRWILENLVLVPEHQQAELCGIKKSYELLFTFEHQRTGEALPPRYDVCQFIIQNIETAKSGHFDAAKYQQDPEKSKKELDEMHDYLWGNETAISDHTQFGTGVFVPSNYEGKN
jgi:hypothetical protein